MNNCGYYIVDGVKFESKTVAAIEATRKQCPLKWYFYNDVWEQFSKEKSHLLGSRNLDELYKERAQQLRDNYDYLILNYSGGADSHNVLMSFLNNGIKLDEIYVTWNEQIDSKVHTPNTTVTGAENLLSEWHFVLKPSLEKIAREHPEIKITVKDPFAVNLDTLYSDNTMERPGHYYGVFELMRQNTIPDSISEQASKGKKVADIWGIDKPYIIFDRGTAYLYFLDATVYGVPRNVEPYGGTTELFYYTIDMPELVFEQGYKVLQYFLEHKPEAERFELMKMKAYDWNLYQWYVNLVKNLIYTTWDNSKFQADKSVPLSKSSRSRDLYYEQSLLFNVEKDRWQHHYKSVFDGLAPHLLTPDKTALSTLANTKIFLGKFE